MTIEEERARELSNDMTTKWEKNIPIILAYADEIKRKCAEVRMQQLVTIYEAGYGMGKWVLESSRSAKVTKLPPTMETSISAAIMDKEEEK